ncbi:hypothetical protein [Nocardia suismassiliense]|uniref:hypothetical protein n=1 Tax=Nocardia suismassiliense TaxID=2077092 RepID=UPI000D1D79D5|nr:hypothetical protein [Nocardia suismassiliense]
MTQREISLKKDETLLVKWIAEPFRYARLVRIVNANGWPNAFIFDIHPTIPGEDFVFSQMEARFYSPYCVLSYVHRDDDRRGHQLVHRDTWGEKTVKQLLVSVLAGYAGSSGGYEIVDWGGFAVSDDRPATQVY